MALSLSIYYEAARELAHRLTEWSKKLGQEQQRFVVCTGGGPGIMEAANRGAAEAKGLNVGLTISIPDEEFDNPYVSRELHFYFHYFFMRKFWFVYLAKAVVLFPGGFGTLDEMFEILTLVQTRKTRKRMPIVLFGTEYWDEVIKFDALVKYGTISPGDLDIFHRTDSVDEAYDIITKGLTERRPRHPRTGVVAGLSIGWDRPFSPPYPLLSLRDRVETRWRAPPSLTRSWVRGHSRSEIARAPPVTFAAAEPDCGPMRRRLCSIAKMWL